jgi:hypothetical protein
MTKPALLFILLHLLTACSDNVNKITDISKHSSEDNTSADSIDIEYVPIYNYETKSTSEKGPIFQALLDSLLQYKKVRELVNDSSACIYIINEPSVFPDTSIKNISAAICNFDKSGCYLRIKFNYISKSTTVMNSCNGQDSLQLYEWNNKNCW